VQKAVGQVSQTGMNRMTASDRLRCLLLEAHQFIHNRERAALNSVCLRHLHQSPVKKSVFFVVLRNCWV